jgi:ethanolamine ammonia-lyase small subunit
MSDQLTPQQKLWQRLRQYTEARIGLGHSGGSITTEHHLAFQYAHACAQDAVWRQLDWSIVEQGLTDTPIELLKVDSKAKDRDQYLQRPDYGRQLSAASRQGLKNEAVLTADAVIVIADGLSSTAIEQNAVPMVKSLVKAFVEHGLTCPYVVMANQSRVALGDEVAEQLQARHLVLLVGERPGLSSPNSLGIYYTYSAQAGYTDAKRNCISNVRQGGQSIDDATGRLMWLVREAERRKLSGVQLKDDSQAETQQLDYQPSNILIP